MTLAEFLLARIAENKRARIAELIAESTPPGATLTDAQLQRLRGTLAWAGIGVSAAAAEIRVHLSPEVFRRAQALPYADHPEFQDEWRV